MSLRRSFPFLSLVVSGGHTTLYLARSVGDYQCWGKLSIVRGESLRQSCSPDGAELSRRARYRSVGSEGGPEGHFIPSNASDFSWQQRR